MSTLFLQIGLILSLAVVLAFFAKSLRLPTLLAYIVTGILVGFSGVFQGEETRINLLFLSELGITFLLFLVGLELRFSDIKYIGKAATYTGLGQIIFTAGIGFFLSRALGFGSLESIYIATALTFSSTIIVVKLLTEKRDLDSLYGKITVGFLLVQDFVAIAALIFIASIGGETGVSSFLTTFIKGLALVGVIVFLNRTLLPIIFDRLAKSLELLFLGGIAWAVIFAAISAVAGFSIEIGAFLAGVGLANLREEHQIAARVRPLRDLFIVIFFIVLGLEMGFGNFGAIFVPALTLSLFVLIGNPLIVMIIMALLGFRARTSFASSVTVAQISEFSLVLAALGLKVGHIGNDVMSLVTAVGLVTIAVSSYIIMNSNKIYKVFAKELKIFQRKQSIERIKLGEEEFAGHVVLVGAGRLGWNIFKGLRKKGFQTVVVEANPEIVKKLQEQNADVIYGDISDPEIFEAAIGRGPNLFLSTVFDQEDTKEILWQAKHHHLAAPIVVTSPEAKLALDFYKEDASYVIIPRILSSQFLEDFLLSSHFGELKNSSLRKEHIEQLGNLIGETSG